jgi:hypothetical protein
MAVNFWVDRVELGLALSIMPEEGAVGTVDHQKTNVLFC